MNVLLGTAGHIDHGKSSLVRLLTGTDPDRLPEEKSRGVTIELGFAHLHLDRPGGKGEGFEVGVVDVPGHSDFVRNMVSGVAALDIVLFVVAADDGWMPQSEEHLQILDHLGRHNAVIALSKADLCEDIEFSKEMLREELTGTFLENSPIIPVSSTTRVGIDELKQTLAEQLVETTKNRSSVYRHRPRLGIDRVFSPKGIGTVVTGSLTGSSLEVGHLLTLEPSVDTSNLRKIQNHNSEVTTALPGMRVALNVPDFQRAEAGKKGIKRGQVLTQGGKASSRSALDVFFRRSDRVVPGQIQTGQPLKLPRQVAVHVGTAMVLGRLISHSHPALAPGESDFCQLRLKEPVSCYTGDRLIVRDASKLSTLGGALVLDASPATGGFHSEGRKEFLAERLEGIDSPITLILSALKADKVLDLNDPVPDSTFLTSEMTKTVEKLRKSKKLIGVGDAIVWPSYWQKCLDDAGKLVTEYHKANPAEPGLSLAQLSEVVPKSLSLDRVISELEKKGFVRSDQTLAAPGYSSHLPESLELFAEEIKATLAQTGRTPPTRSVLAPSSEHEEALRFLIRTGEVVSLEPKVMISSAVLKEMKKDLVERFRKTSEMTASEIKNILGTTRKVVMPFLELMDEQKVTQRNGDLRSLLE